MDDVTRADVIRAREDLVRLGILEDSGERRPDRAGVMRVVWQLSPRGQMAADDLKRRLTGNVPPAVET